jgi:pilus assembly protein CpaC
LRRAIHQVTGDDRVQVQQVEDMLLLSGKVDNAATVQDVLTAASRYLPRSVRVAPDLTTAGTYILNRMEIDGSNQVNIRVRIAEVSRSAIKSLGITTHAANPTLFGDVDVAIGFDSTVAAAESLATGGISTMWGATTLSTALDALASDGLASVLAEPNLTALSGETANFLAGGEYPIPIVDSSSGVSTVNVQFREYGIRLAFTPTVTSGGRINLRVRPEVSELDNSTAVSFGTSFIPGLRTRRAETSVELGSGQSFAIAGLLKNDSSQDVSKYPGLGDIPILGALFRSERFQQDQSELVILVTPYLVKPVAANNLQSPTDGYVPPNDVDRHLHNRLVSTTPTPAPVHTAERGGSAADAGLVGPVGYVLQ